MSSPALVPDAAALALPRRSGARRHPNAAIWAWALVGWFAYLLFPWYALQEANGLLAMGQAWSAPETGNGLLHATAFGKYWLLAGLAGLSACTAAGAMTPGRRQGAVLVAGGFGAAATLLAAGFAIGAKGWSFHWLDAVLGELGVQQFGIGWGGAIALAALVALGAFGVARRGGFRGDLFVSAAVVCTAALLALFIVYPVFKALAAAFAGEDGQPALPTLVARIFNERNFGLGCLSGGVRCGVAWNTLFLGVLTAGATTVLGTLLALMAERGGQRWARPLNILAMLPIITPPFVVGLGLILLFGRAGIFNQLLEWVFGVEPSRWFYGWFGVWLAQTFAFTPIA
ncbi:MAG: binding--dependent transport system inner rane component family protein, partial [Ramlibacter sp.]|nr:binding--dependent transport system inner rane component family protein [Ramlibacter sp.]